MGKKNHEKALRVKCGSSTSEFCLLQVISWTLRWHPKDMGLLPPSTYNITSIPDSIQTHLSYFKTFVGPKHSYFRNPHLHSYHIL